MRLQLIHIFKPSMSFDIFTDTAFYTRVRLARIFLRSGLAFVFLYAALEMSYSPENFLKYVPDVMERIIPPLYFLPAFAVSEVALAAFLFSGVKERYAAYAAFGFITGITFFNIGHFSVLFRNVAIAFGALALAALAPAASESEGS